MIGKNVRLIQHNAVVYDYPGGQRDIICATAPMFREPGWEPADDSERRQGAARTKGKKSEGSDMQRSMRRARAQLRRLALANNFQYFVTLTLDPAKIDRYDPTAVTKALNRWTDNMVRRHGLRYILVPELHQDGAFHFHGFMAGDGLIARDSGHQLGGRAAYNLPQWTLGFSTAQELYGEYSAAVAYCCKYIGKQSDQRPLGRWYYSGGALSAPKKTYVDMEYRDLQTECEFAIPGAKIKVLHQKENENHEKRTET